MENAEQYISAANLGFTVIGAALVFVYNTMNKRIDKLEETSRRDDERDREQQASDRETLLREMEMRRNDIIAVHAKVEANDRRCQKQGERIAFLEGLEEGKRRGNERL